MPRPSLDEIFSETTVRPSLNEIFSETIKEKPKTPFSIKEIPEVLGKGLKTEAAG